MTQNLTKLSLASMLGLVACAGPSESYIPFCSGFRHEPRAAVIDPSKVQKPKDPKIVYGVSNNGSFSQLGTRKYDFSTDHSADLNNSYQVAYFESNTKGLPIEIVDGATSVDLGLARVAASGDSVLVRPLYSSAHRYILDNDLYAQRNRGFSSSPVYLDDQFAGSDDPERVKREEGMVVSSLLRWAWGWDVFTPLRNTANNVRDYSNQVVKDALGSNSDFDYTGRRIVLGYNIPVDRFYLEFDFWADIANPDQNGVSIQMSLPFGTRN